MNPLLSCMKLKQPLGPDDLLPETRIHDALEDIFYCLSEALGLNPSEASSQVFFSTDRNESALGIKNDDQFELAVIQRLGMPNAKICHMRFFADETGERAHWHALFAEMDSCGDLKKIILTDSRLKGKLGITAQRDIEENFFLKEHSQIIQFEAGPQQPFGIPICWVYCLANLASLAATGKVYQPKTSNLGNEIAEIIETHIHPKKEHSTEVSVISSNKSDQTVSVPQTVLTKGSTSPPKDYRLFSSPQSTTSNKTEKMFLNSESEIIDSDVANPTEQFAPLEGLLLLAGTSTLLLGGLIIISAFPLSLAIGLSVLSLGFVLSLTGAGMLIENCLAEKQEGITEEHSNLAMF